MHCRFKTLVIILVPLLSGMYYIPLQYMLADEANKTIVHSCGAADDAGCHCGSIDLNTFEECNTLFMTSRCSCGDENQLKASVQCWRGITSHNRFFHYHQFDLLFELQKCTHTQVHIEKPSKPPHILS